MLGEHHAHSSSPRPTSLHALDALHPISPPAHICISSGPILPSAPSLLRGRRSNGAQLRGVSTHLISAPIFYLACNSSMKSATPKTHSLCRFVTPTSASASAKAATASCAVSLAALLNLKKPARAWVLTSPLSLLQMAAATTQTATDVRVWCVTSAASSPARDAAMQPSHRESFLSVSPQTDCFPSESSSLLVDRLKEGYIGSTGIFGCPPGGCESCCLLWADWIERHKGLQTPAASPFCKRDVFARLFCTLTPKTETRVGKRQTPLGSDQSCGPLGHCQRRLKLDDTDGSGDGDAQEGAAECNTELPQKRQKRPRMEESADGDSCMSCEELSTSGRHPHTPLSHGQTSSSVGGSPDAVLHSPSPSVAQGSGCLQPLEGFAGPGRTGKAREGCDVLQPIMGLTPVNSPDDPVGGLLCSTDKSTVHEPRGRGPNKGGSDASIYRSEAARGDDLFFPCFFRLERASARQGDGGGPPLAGRR